VTDSVQEVRKIWADFNVYSAIFLQSRYKKTTAVAIATTAINLLVGENEKTILTVETSFWKYRTRT
jgi:hypothetical protein